MSHDVNTGESMRSIREHQYVRKIDAGEYDVLHTVPWA